MQTVPHDQLIDVPPEIAVCPKCGGKLYVELDAWTQDDDGTWKAESPHTTCEHEPDLSEDIDVDEYDEWFDWHYDMPYVDWLPIDMIVEDWLDKNYRFSGL